MSDSMFRYLEKYVGTYRVKAHFDEVTKDFPRDKFGSIPDSFEDLYIDCAKGEIRHSYEPNTLVWYTDKLGQGRNVRRQLEASHKVVNTRHIGDDEVIISCKGGFEFKYEENDEDVLIWFNEKDIRKIDSLVSIRTSGKTIKPFSTSNLPKGGYKISEEDELKLSSIYKDMPANEKMAFVKKAIKEFDEVIKKKKGKKALDARKESGLKSKEYIHYLGLWEEFLKFVRKKYDSR